MRVTVQQEAGKVLKNVLLPGARPAAAEGWESAVGQASHSTQSSLSVLTSTPSPLH